ncbi:CDGSH iron-sulfur domain-containing protein [archaeon]|nr:MAG: CDGSH iron-sulfur domain-containing protein [archaeon]
MRGAPFTTTASVCFHNHSYWYNTFKPALVGLLSPYSYFKMDGLSELVELFQQNPLLLVLFVVLPFGLIVLFTQGNEKKTEEPEITRINNKVKLDSPKVVDMVKCADMEDMAQYKDGKLIMCRCWKSETFPYCDGSHVRHNKETGDNVGPLIIQK